MQQTIKDKCQPWMLVALAVVIYMLFCNQKETFLPSFPSSTDHVPEPTLKEEVGQQKYPQGHGVGMNVSDSNALPPKKVLLKSKTTYPQAYGESTLADDMGVKGTSDGCRVLELKSMGDQDSFKSYSRDVNNYVFEDQKDIISYDDSWSPSKEGLRLACSPGKKAPAPCQEWVPNNFKVDDQCITAGDLPYDDPQLPNPRMVSRADFFTGNFDDVTDTDYNNGGQLFPVVAM